MCPQEDNLPDGHAVSIVGWGERIARLLMTRSPLGPLVRWVAGIRASIHAKLLCAFLFITLLFIAMGAISLQAVARVSQQSRLLDQAHVRVDWSRQIQQALAMQMNLTAMTLLLKDESTVSKILRENNRFNDTLARLEEAAPPEERELIQRIRTAQADAMSTVADIANLIRDGKIDEAMTLQLSKEHPLYLEIEGVVNQLVQTERDKMDNLRRSVAAANRRILIVIAGFVGTSILLSLTLGFVVSWSFILPVREAHGFLSQVAEGNFGATITVPNRDEFGVLAAHMNEMSRELDRLYEHEQEAARDLLMLNEQLERASKAKSEFLANMSHELRTPLNAIIGFSEVLREKMFGELNEKQEEYLDDISSSGKHLLSLINDVLDLSKVEAGKLELELGVFDLRQLLQGSLVMVKEAAVRDNITLSLDVADEIGEVIGDERKVKQTVFNILSNAVKFTPDKGKVGIRARRTDDVVQIAIWDTGVGIALDDQERIFEEFQQVGKGPTGKTGGTGLGLALAKKFVELHGGAIWVESSPDRGSTFTFTLPIKSDAGHAPLTTVQEKTAEEVLIEAPSARPLVLVIEDDRKAADLLRIYLTEAGCAVEIAEDGVEGLEKAKRLSPDAIVLDVLLPKVDGWAFLTHVKSDPATKDVPVIIVSIVDQKGKGFALGAADYLVKPIQKEGLLKTLDTFGLISKARTAPMKILAIDDDAKAVELLAAVLEPEGFRVLKAYGGEEGIEVAKTERPDLIILDLLMPGMNGFEVLDRLEKSSVTRRLPIIIFTVKQLTAEEKGRLKGRIARLAQKEEYTPQHFVGMVKDVMQRSLGGRK